MLLGVSACFSANKDGSVDLPFGPATEQIRPDEAALARLGPVRMAPQYAEALQSVRAIWIDAGTRDEWFPRSRGRGVLRHPAGYRGARRPDPSSSSTPATWASITGTRCR